MKIYLEDSAQGLLERLSAKAPVQDPCVRLSKSYLRARPLLSSPGLYTRSPSEVSWQEMPRERARGMTSRQGVYRRFLGKTSLYEISVKAI